MKFGAFAISIGIVALATSSALAEKPGDRGDNPGLGWGKGGNHQVSYSGGNGQRGDNDGGNSHGHVVGVPGPIAGVGLPFAAAGLYIWRRNRRAKTAKALD